jgi:hypothetical protein
MVMFYGQKEQVGQVRIIGNNDLFIAKYTSSGTSLWTIRGDGIGDDEGLDMVVNENQLIVAGCYQNYANFGTP